jgi:hypothetical protein
MSRRTLGRLDVAQSPRRTRARTVSPRPWLPASSPSGHLLCSDLVDLTQSTLRPYAERHDGAAPIPGHTAPVAEGGVLNGERSQRRATAMTPLYLPVRQGVQPGTHFRT